MTLGILIPLALLVLGVIEAILFRQLSHRGILKENVATVLILVSLIFPLAAYGVLNFALPEIAAITVP